MILNSCCLAEKLQNVKKKCFLIFGGGQDKPAWTACPPGVKITRVGGKISRDILPPGGQAVQGGKITVTPATSPSVTDMVQTIIFSWLFGSHDNVAHLFLHCSDLIFIRNTSCKHVRVMHTP